VPGVGNPQAWNRYAYVLYNPVRYTDPSGHFNEYRTEEEPVIRIKVNLPNILEDIYGLSFIGTWAFKELETINSGVMAIQNYLDNLGLSGMRWIKQYLGTAFKHGSFMNDGKNNFVMGGIMHLTSGFSMSTVVHEFGHVLDNNIGYKRKYGTIEGVLSRLINSETVFPWILDAAIFGGGPADDLFQAMSLFGVFNPYGIRGCNGACTLLDRTYANDIGVMRLISPDNSYNTGDYANWSSADFFAVTFEFMILGNEKPKTGPVEWMINNIFIKDIH